MISFLLVDHILHNFVYYQGKQSVIQALLRPSISVVFPSHKVVWDSESLGDCGIIVDWENMRILGWFGNDSAKEILGMNFKSNRIVNKNYLQNKLGNDKYKWDDA